MSFWLGILCAAVVGIPFSIAANLWTDPVRGYLGNRQVAKLNQTRDRELRRYWYVRHIMAGSGQVLADLQFRQSYAIHGAVFAGLYYMMMLSIGFFAYVGQKTEVLHSRTAAVVFIICTIGAAALAATSMLQMFNVLRIMRRVRNFTAYEQSIIEKWGEPVPEDQ
ncbi:MULTISPECIES: hypothetical protein [Bradyrhizobium]|uniref:DUF2721 domain-containing protein n=2 Tax=Bradyrhizobium barranii subsp. barranii TaxID=2823807 RepID=A0A939S411_9BRAD|nr:MULTISPECIES: hypothetical protein [Bradyrhizobium]UEM17025.1 hypothetical protein J4G43_024045 [Bradyrhizobium barranii subsp. barranii]